MVLQMEPVERFGIVFDGPWSRPLVARKQPFAKLPSRRPPRPSSGSASKFELEARIARLQKEKAALEERLEQEKAALVKRIEKLETQLRLAAGSRWLGLGPQTGFGSKPGAIQMIPKLHLNYPESGEPNQGAQSGMKDKAVNLSVSRFAGERTLRKSWIAAPYFRSN